MKSEISTRKSEQLIREKYERDGPDHVNTYLQLTFRKHIDLIQSVFELPQKACLLDIGSGTGQFLLELVQRGFEATGIDTFEELDGIDERITMEKFSEQGLIPTLMKGNASHLPFPDESFHLVTNFGMLEHIPPDIRSNVIREMFRVVKPDGYLFIMAGPNKYFPYDQHIPRIPFANWLPRRLKIALAEKIGPRLMLNAPWAISRRELRDALPEEKAVLINLYARYMGMPSGGSMTGFSLHPLRLAAYLKRTWRLHKAFGRIARLLELLSLEHCHIVAFKKRLPTH